MKCSSTLSLALVASLFSICTAQTTPSPTPSMSPSKSNCTTISVLGDAIFCVNGPICSGNGTLPAGINCPKAGDRAVSSSCLDYHPSYTAGGSCVAPADAECTLLLNSTWGCVWGIDGSGSDSGSGSDVGDYVVGCDSDDGSDGDAGSTSDSGSGSDSDDTIIVIIGNLTLPCPNDIKSRETNATSSVH